MISKRQGTLSAQMAEARDVLVTRFGMERSKHASTGLSPGIMTKQTGHASASGSLCPQLKKKRRSGAPAASSSERNPSKANMGG